MNRLTLFITGCLAAIGVGVAVFGFAMFRFLNSPLDIGEDPVDFEISAGSGFGVISRRLAERGYLAHPDWYRWYARATGRAGAVHAGEYRISPGTTPRQLLQMFVDGDVRLYSFTIVEGWTFRDLVTALGQHATLEADMDYEDWPALLESFGAEEQHPEGLFLPETYRYPKGTTVTDILRQAYALMRETLAEEWQNRRVNLPFTTPYEALILASIVEKETALAEERPRIAGVFVRRLEKNMRLQTDPTVIYGLGQDFDGNLTRRHLRSDTPYNTYTRRGLPPTPIALPGRAAINAAVQPAEGSELYFVATGLADGSHKFSDTKEEHDAAVQEFLQRRRQQRARPQ
ncbi:MAG: endolytic transglycosylase MltG [Woeseiaceae bacterium]|nr:endolytic transglycosylase MltG [Woeseiaceae bacterium]